MHRRHTSSTGACNCREKCRNAYGSDIAIAVVHTLSGCSVLDYVSGKEWLDTSLDGLAVLCSCGVVKLHGVGAIHSVGTSTSRHKKHADTVGVVDLGRNTDQAWSCDGGVGHPGHPIFGSLILEIQCLGSSSGGLGICARVDPGQFRDGLLGRAIPQIFIGPPLPRLQEGVSVLGRVEDSGTAICATVPELELGEHSRCLEASGVLDAVSERVLDLSQLWGIVVMVALCSLRTVAARDIVEAGEDVVGRSLKEHNRRRVHGADGGVALVPERLHVDVIRHAWGKQRWVSHMVTHPWF